MTTPNRPPFPDWYQQDKPVPPHVGPTQRELMARRIRTVRNFLIGASFVGAATFTTLAAYHTQAKNNAAAAAAAQSTPAETAPQVASNVSTTQAPSSSFFDNSQTSGFSAESHEHEGENESDDGGNVAQSAAPTQAPAPAQPTTPATSSSQSNTAPSTTQTQPTTPQITAPTSSRHRTHTVSS